jgi:hypothetical protein
MTWQELTVGQFQLLNPIIKDNKLNDLEKEAAVVAALFDMTADQVDAMPWAQFGEYRQKIAFLTSDKIPTPPAPEVLVTPDGKRYRVNYDLPKMEVARYVEINHFLNDGVREGSDLEPTIDRLHLLMASICAPEGRPYNSDDHRAYAEELQTVPYVEARAVLVFFCRLYAALLKTMRASLAERIARREEIPTTEAARILGALCAAMDGIIISSV